VPGIVQARLKCTQPKPFLVLLRAKLRLLCRAVERPPLIALLKRLLLAPFPAKV
jgi:hypothetical protein